MISSRLLVVAVAALCFLLVLLSLFAVLIRPVRVESLESHVIVENVVGINLETDKLYFGTVNPGGSAKRFVSVAASEPFFVRVVPEGDMGPWLFPKPSSFVLDGSRKVNFVLAIPLDVPEGEYSGSVRIALYRPWVRFLSATG